MRRYAVPRLLAVLLVVSAALGAAPATAERDARPDDHSTSIPPYRDTSASSFGNPYLVEDTTTAGYPEGGNPFGYAVLPGAVLFVADTPGTGDELWRSGGFITNTEMVVELYPGSERGVYSPAFMPERALVNYAGRLYFGGINAHHGVELWATDGTLTGTVLVRDIATGTARSEPEYLIPYNGELYFAADDDVHGQELWKTDGTYTGTVLVKDINTGLSNADIEDLVAYDGRLWFNARTSSHGEELWASDGTVTGTALFLNIATTTSSSSPENFATAGGLLYFTADTASHGRELWRTDGTLTGTLRLSDIGPGTDDAYIYYRPAAAYGYAFFSAYEPTYGTELYRSDGTVTGTVRVTDIYTGSGSASPYGMLPFNSAVYYWADDGVNDHQLWRSTLTVTEMVPNAPLFEPGPIGPLFAHGSYLYFAAKDATYGRELWRYDGAAFTRLTDLNPGAADSSPDNFFAPNANNLVFVANDGVTGNELYRINLTNPVSPVITLVRNIAPDALSTDIDDLGGVGAGQAFFEVYNSTHGSEPYASDGTPAGTGSLGDLYPGNGGSNPAPFAGLGDGRALFAAYSDTTGNEPWVSDGTLTGTLPLRDIYTGTLGSNPEGFTPVAGGAVFFANDGVLGDELWFTDGTPGGTLFVRDIYTGVESSFGGDFGSLPGLMLFAANDGVHGEELWATDGTHAGTTRLTDLDAGSYQDLYPYDFVTAGNRVFFIGYDLEGNDSLYVTNGLTATLVIDPDDSGLTQFNDLLPGATGVYFNEFGIDAWNVWWADGYTYTQRTSFTASDEQLNLQEAVTVGDRLFFRYCDLTYGCELWSLTPTSPAALVRDIYPGLQSSDPTDLAAVDGYLIFAAADPVGGREMWISDGTFAGTQRLADIAPGAGHSNPEQMTVSGVRLFFTAYSEAAGYELWVMDLAQKLFLPLLSR